MKYFHRKQSAELGLTMMLVAVVTVFFICNLLAFLVNILEVNKEDDTYFILFMLSSALRYLHLCFGTD